MNSRIRRLVAAAGGAGLIIGALLALGPAGAASADPVSAPVCGAAESTSGTALSGTYGNLTVNGIAYVAADATLTVRGNLILAPGACLDAFSTGTVHVGGNVVVQRGAVLALGCAPFANGEPMPCGQTTTDDSVGGNIAAAQPLTMYLTAVWVGGNVTSTGGGPGTASVGTSFPIKNMNIRGNLVVTGWQGGWFGALRNTVGGNMVITNNSGSRPGESGAPDSTEITANNVSGNLVCTGNTPSARFGDAEPVPNTVRGNVVGECAALVGP